MKIICGTDFSQHAAEAADVAAAFAARGVDALQHVCTADSRLHRFNAVGAELLPEHVLELALLRLAEKSGAGLLGRLLKLFDLALHLLYLKLLLTQLELMLVGCAAADLERDLVTALRRLGLTAGPSHGEPACAGSAAEAGR